MTIKTPPRVDKGKLTMKITLNKIRKTSLLFLCNCIAIVICSSEVHLIAQSSDIAAKDTKAKEAADAATKAIGGAGKIGEIKSLIIKGTLTRVPHQKVLAADGTPRKQSPLGMEMRILLPDNFVLIRQVNLGRPSYRGVSKGILIPPPPSAELSPQFYGVNSKITDDSETSSKILETLSKGMELKDEYEFNNSFDEFSRFLIGMFMKSGSTPITISSGSTRGVFTLEKKDAVLGEIEFDTNGYPSVIRYKNPEFPSKDVVFGDGFYYGTDGRIIISGEKSGQNMGGGEIRFQDRFYVGGVMFPKVITTTQSGGSYTEEFHIEEALINPNLSLKDFEIPK